MGIKKITIDIKYSLMPVFSRFISYTMKMKKDLFNLRFQHVTGQLENPIKMRETKRDIARVKTIIREKELAKVQD